MTPSRVLMTADAVGGVWTYALELAQGLARSGVEVLLVVLGPAPAEAQWAAVPAGPRLTLTVPCLGLEWQDQSGPLAAEARLRLLALEEAFRPDIVHCNSFREAAAGFTAPVLLAAHSCVLTWWRACRGGEVPAEWQAYSDGVRQGLAASAALVAPSASFLADLHAGWGRLPSASVIPNGLDLKPRRRAKQPVILAAGRLWDEAKNIAALAQIAPDLPWPVLVAGAAAPGGAGEGLQHLGNLAPAELRARMAEAAIFAAPSRYEPFGLAILEAAACGCALVLGEIPSLVELWAGAARFVPPDRPAALRAALLELIGDPVARAQLQAAARERARSYGRVRMTSAYLDRYATLAPAPHPRPEAWPEAGMLAPAVPPEARA